MHLLSCEFRLWRRAVKKWLTAQPRVAVLFVLAVLTVLPPIPAMAANDLLVAPTRLTFEGRTRSTEVILKNIGPRAATYRISLVARRMSPDGDIVEVDTPNAGEALAEKMVRFAPRRVRLEPNQPQSIRVAIRKPADLADGEYRIHMMFRAIPDPDALAPPTETPTEGLAIRLTPIYGVTIPLIVRHGELDSSARIVALERAEEGPRQGLRVRLEQLGSRSVYGELVVDRPGMDEPLARARGIALYPEVTTRDLFIDLSPDFAGSVEGPVRIRYYDESDGGRVLLDEMTTVIG